MRAGITCAVSVTSQPLDDRPDLARVDAQGCHFQLGVVGIARNCGNEGPAPRAHYAAASTTSGDSATACRIAPRSRSPSQSSERPGFSQANANPPCAGLGSFGAFGKDNNFAGGASGDRTACNNSTLCANPQGAAGELNP